MSITIKILCVVLLTVFLAANGDMEIRGFDKTRWFHDTETNDFEYKFYDGEQMTLFCSDKNFKRPGTLGWKWNDVSVYTAYNKTEVRFSEILTSEHNGRSLKCILQLSPNDSSPTYIRIKLILDPDLPQHPDYISVTGFNQARWEYIQTTVQTPTQYDRRDEQIRVYRYHFYEGEILNVTCKKVNQYIIHGSIGWGNHIHALQDKPMDFWFSQHERSDDKKYMNCTLINVQLQKSVVSTELLLITQLPSGLKYPDFKLAPFEINGFKENRLHYSSMALNNFTYYFKTYEAMFLYCEKKDSAPGRTEWTYFEGISPQILNQEAFEVQIYLKPTVLSTFLTCNYQLYGDQTYWTIAKYYINFQRCTNQSVPECGGPIRADEDKFGCMRSNFFYVTGFSKETLKNLQREGKDEINNHICTATLTTDKPLTLDLECVIDVIPRKRIGYSPLILYLEKEGSSQIIAKGNDCSVKHKFVIEEKHNQKVINCTTSKLGAPAPAIVYSIIIKISFIQTTSTSTTTSTLPTSTSLSSTVATTTSAPVTAASPTQSQSSTGTPTWQTVCYTLLAVALVTVLVACVRLSRRRCLTSSRLTRNTQNDLELDEVEHEYAYPTIPQVSFYAARRLITSNKKLGEGARPGENHIYDYAIPTTGQ